MVFARYPKKNLQALLHATCPGIRIISAIIFRNTLHEADVGESEHGDKKRRHITSERSKRERGLAGAAAVVTQKVRWMRRFRERRRSETEFSDLERGRRRGERGREVVHPSRPMLSRLSPLQGSAKRWSPGYVNAAGKARQKW